MSGQTSQPNSDSDETQEVYETQTNSEFDETLDTKPDEDRNNQDIIIYPFPEDYMANIPARKYRYHKLDAGMVEVSLALAGLVFTVATITNNFSDDLPIWILIPVVFLVLATHVVALWFLSAYCVQHDLIEGERNDSWHNPFAILSLLKCGFTDRKEKRAGIYPWLAYCVLFLIGIFAISFFI